MRIRTWALPSGSSRLVFFSKSSKVPAELTFNKQLIKSITSKQN